MKIKYKSSALLVLISLLNTSNTLLCLTTFVNDKPGKIMIYNKNDKTLICIGRNEKRRLGNKYQNAHFVIYAQQQNKPVIPRMYSCKQAACNENGNIHLRYSDIENNKGAAHFFHITKHTPHSSMAQILSQLQKNHLSYDE